MIGIFRTSIPGSSVAGVTSATIVQTLFFTAVSVVIVTLTAFFRPHTVSKGIAGGTRAAASSPLTAYVIPLIARRGERSSSRVLWPRLKPKVLQNQWHKAKQGASDLQRSGGATSREVALPSSASYLCTGRRQHRVHGGDSASR